MYDEPKFHVCLMGQWLEDVGQAYQWGLQTLGYDTTCARGQVDPERINLLFAGVGVSLSQYHRHGMVRGINVNLEQVGTSHPQIVSARAFHLMRNLPVWDYSRFNLDPLHRYGIADVRHVPLGYCPLWERIEKIEEDIDVVFYGGLSPRRLAILEQLEARGLRVVFPRSYDAWSPEHRDAMIGRAKVVLNLAFYDQVHVLEEVRLSFLFANRKAVVSEVRPDTCAEGDMLANVAGAPTEKLPDLCVRLCADPARRQALAAGGYQAVRERDWLLPLRTAVDDYLSRAAIGYQSYKVDLPPPKKLNVGSGKSWKYDFLNLDVLPERGADVIFDLNEPLDHDKVFDSWRFGKIKLAPESFDYILSEHVFEHVRNLTQCMRTCLDLLQVGGVLEIEVPYDLSHGAWQDPTHVRAFNERSWVYYGDWCWYLGWRDFRFDQESIVYVPSPYGQSLSDRGMELDDLIRHPRAIDAMRVKLRKRALSEQEQANHQMFFAESN